MKVTARGEGVRCQAAGEAGEDELYSFVKGSLSVPSAGNLDETLGHHTPPPPSSLPHRSLIQVPLLQPEVSSSAP